VEHANEATAGALHGGGSGALDGSGGGALERWVWGVPSRDLTNHGDVKCVVHERDWEETRP
jgi:hypothetical protein